MENSPDYKSFVGKTFKLKEATGSHEDLRFKITGLVPGKDFGSLNGGRADAFVVERTPHAGVHTPKCKDFLATHEEVTESAE